MSSTESSSSGSSSSFSVGVGIVGLGWGSKIQIPAFQQAGLHVVGICGRRPEVVNSIVKQYHLSFGTTQYEELLARPDIHAISIVTPPSEHASMAIAALRAGKHVLCEKPFTMNLKQAHEIHDVWEQEKVKAQAADRPSPLFVIDHELRMLPLLSRMRAIVTDESTFGHIMHVDHSFMGAIAAAPIYNWWSQTSMGGGLLGAVGSHAIDTISFLTGGVTTHVSAHLHTLVKQKPDSEGKIHDVTSDDHAQLHLMMARSGKSFPVAMTLSGLTTGYTHKKLTIVGSKATVTWDMATLKVDWWRATEPGKAPEHESYGPDAVPDSSAFPPPALRFNAFAVGTVFIAERLRDVITSLHTGTPLDPSSLALFAGFESGFHTQAVIDAAHTSHQQHGTSVPIPHETTPS